MYRLLVVILPVLLFLIGCQPDPEDISRSGNSDPQKTVESGVNKDQIVSLLDRQTYANLIEQHAGKILVINVWATWCVPCKEEFPDLVRLASEYQNSDVTVVGISVDYPDEIETRIKPFLKQNSVNFINYVQNFKHQEDLIDLLNTDWHGAVPATFIYDDRGQQQAFLLGKHTFDEFETAIENINR